VRGNSNFANAAVGPAIPSVLSATRNLSSDHAVKSRFVGKPSKWSVKLPRNRLVGHVPQKDLANDVMDQNETSGELRGSSAEKATMRSRPLSAADFPKSICAECRPSWTKEGGSASVKFLQSMSGGTHTRQSYLHDCPAGIRFNC